MANQRYRSSSLIDQLQRELSSNRHLQSHSDANFSSEDWSPAVDITENTDSFVIFADLPGVKVEDIDVTTENGLLTIKGQRDSEKTEKQNSFKRVERFSGRFMRRFTLPETADVEHIEARTKEGVLVLTIPKLPQTQPRKIEVKMTEQ